MSKPIYLIGFMGSGKTSLGKKLAQKLNRDFFDLDQIIEKKSQKTITGLFHELGENGFRSLEQQALIELSSNLDCVISLGGGTPCFEINREIIKKTGISVYLKLDESILIGRLRLKKAKRPLIANLEDKEISKFVHEKLKEREIHYKQADYILESNHPNVGLILDVMNQESI